MTDQRAVMLGGAVGAEPVHVIEALDSVHVIINVEAGTVPAVAAAIVGLVAQLARIFPYIEVLGDCEVGRNAWNVHRLSNAVSAFDQVKPTASSKPKFEFQIGVGASISRADLWIGGDDWTAVVGFAPQRIGPVVSALGVHAATSLAAAEVLKFALRNMPFISIRADGDIIWNLLDYRCRAGGPVEVTNNKPIEVVMFGCGSVGSSVAAIMACMPMTGNARLVDGDTFDSERNPFRYPAALGNESGSKASWLDGMLHAAGWVSESYDGTVGSWVSKQDEPGVSGIAISSVDTVEGRLQVADALAATTLSLGVSGLALHLQREHLGDGFACPFCEFVTLSPALSLVESHAAMTGLSVERVAELLLENERIREEDVIAAQASGRITAATNQLVGKRLPDLIRRAYADAVVATEDGEQVAVASPFVSWMGGVMANAELYKSALGLTLVHRRVDLDLSGIPLGVVRQRPADESGRCICGPGIRNRWAEEIRKKQWQRTTMTQNSFVDLTNMTTTHG